MFFLLNLLKAHQIIVYDNVLNHLYLDRVLSSCHHCKFYLVLICLTTFDSLKTNLTKHTNIHSPRTDKISYIAVS